MYTVLKTMPHVLAWDRLGARIALDVALGEHDMLRLIHVLGLCAAYKA